MAKFNGGFGGGGGNMQQLMKQAQQMQENMKKAQEELAETEITGSTAGGLVEVTLSGNKEMLAVSIKPEAVDVDDLEMLEDMIIAAYNEAIAEVERVTQEKLGPMAGAFGGLL